MVKSSFTKMELPLMHHFMKQRVDRVVPSVSLDVAPADRDFRGAAAGGSGVMTEPALHAARDPHDNRPKRIGEMLLTQSRMLGDEARRPVGVVGMAPLSPTNRRISGRIVRNDQLARVTANGSCSALHESNDCIEHLRTRREVPLMNA